MTGCVSYFMIGDKQEINKEDVQNANFIKGELGYASRIGGCYDDSY